MTIVTIYFKDPANPYEVQEWLNRNVGTIITASWVYQNFVYFITNP